MYENCDINALEKFVLQAKVSPEFCDIIIGNCYALPRLWKHQIIRDGATPSTSNPSAKSPSESPKGAKDRAKTRDNSRCVITKFSLLEVAHIFPHCLLSPRKTDLTRALPTTWQMLFLFFDRDSVHKWQDAAFSDSNNPKDITENLICLQPSLHSAWAAGLCAFKPISLSPDRKELEIEFHWLLRQTHGPLDLVELSKPQPSSHGIDEVDGNEFIVGNHILCTGERFTLRTFDPDNFPLPSFAIFDMQWRLAQILSLSAAAEDPESDEVGAASVPANPLNIPWWIEGIPDDDYD